MRRSATVPLLLLLLGSSGCSTITANRVSPLEKTPGIRYWLAAPYLLVRSTVEVARTESIYRLDMKPDPEGKWRLVPVREQGEPSSGGGAGAASELVIDPNEPLGRVVFAALDRSAAAGVRPVMAAKPAGGGPSGPPVPKNPAPGGQVQPGQPGAGTGTTGGTPPAAAPTSPGAGTPAGSGSTSEAVSVVWLPDYCEQYALQQTNILASSKLKVELGDGWKLSSFDSTLDSTQLVGKVLDLAGAAAGLSKGGGGGGTAGGGGGAAATPQAARTYVYLRKVTVSNLRPGLYPLITRENDDCDKRAKITGFKVAENLVQSVTWTVVPAAVAWP
jgi:hypothetical protein